METPNVRDHEGFWGVPTSTIDWCEPNYQVSYYVAEWWNTISNVLFIVLGLYGFLKARSDGFELRFQLGYIGIIFTGLGSTLFHGTLKLVNQQFDETPMVWAMLIWIYTAYSSEIERLPVSRNAVVGSLFFLGLAFTIAHAIYRFTTVFQVFFCILALVCSARLAQHYRQTKNATAKSVAMAYVRNTLIGTGLWLLDYHYCSAMQQLPVNPQAHAWWHIFTGLATYYGPVFMQYIRMEELNKDAEIERNAFGIYTIEVEDGGMPSKKKL